MVMANRLAGETSPYLLQHAHNPVDWYPWGQEALERARREDKPILLSIGYSACHWCHVMERESFEDEGIAALMNREFVSIKVDREERPDLDHIYQNVVQMAVTATRSEVCTNTNRYVSEFCMGLSQLNPSNKFACAAQSIDYEPCVNGVCACGTTTQCAPAAFAARRPFGRWIAVGASAVLVATLATALAFAVGRNSSSSQRAGAAALLPPPSVRTRPASAAQ